MGLAPRDQVNEASEGPVGSEPGRGRAVAWAAMSASSSSDAAPVWVVVVAAGSGRRFGGAKQYEPLAGQRVIDWSLAAARTVADGVVVVVPADRMTEEPAADVVVAGGETRSASVRAGLAAVPDDAAVVLVHDAARPMASHALFRSVVDAVLAGADVAVPAIAMTDSMCDPSGLPVDRESLRAVQTPQGFRADALRRVHATAPEATDDASLAIGAGGRARLVQGERWNLKITDPDDLAVAALFLEQR